MKQIYKMLQTYKVTIKNLRTFITFRDAEASVNPVQLSLSPTAGKHCNKYNNLSRLPTATRQPPQLDELIFLYPRIGKI